MKEEDMLIEYMQAEFNKNIDDVLKQALRYRFKDDGMTIIVKDNKVTFLGNTKYSLEELSAAIEEVKNVKP